MPRPRPKRAFLILAGAQPPQLYRFQQHLNWWFRKVSTLTEALEIARGLALIGIHGVIKSVQPDNPSKPVAPRRPYIRPASERRNNRNLRALIK